MLLWNCRRGTFLTRGLKANCYLWWCTGPFADDKSRQLLALLIWEPYTFRTKQQCEKCSLADGQTVFYPYLAHCLLFETPWGLQQGDWDTCSYFNGALNDTEEPSLLRWNHSPRATSLQFCFSPLSIQVVDIRSFLCFRALFCPLYYFFILLLPSTYLSSRDEHEHQHSLPKFHEDQRMCLSQLHNSF